MNLNKNISVWRGNNTPPSQYHLWLKGDVLLHHNGLEWVENKVPMASPSLNGLMSKEDKDKLDELADEQVVADEEDITSVNGQLKLKDRDNTNGMGYVILRKNKSFAEQVTQENTIYEIRYEFDLNREIITIPENCILKFEGGKIKNGTINFTDTTIVAETISFSDIEFQGTIANNDVDVNVFGAGNHNLDNTSILNNIFSFGIYNEKRFIFHKETYNLNGSLELWFGYETRCSIIGNGATLLQNTDNIPILICHECCNIDNIKIKYKNEQPTENTRAIAISYSRLVYSTIKNISITNANTCFAPVVDSETLHPTTDRSMVNCVIETINTWQISGYFVNFSANGLSGLTSGTYFNNIYFGITHYNKEEKNSAIAFCKLVSNCQVAIGEVNIESGKLQHIIEIASNACITIQTLHLEGIELTKYFFDINNSCSILIDDFNIDYNCKSSLAYNTIFSLAQGAFVSVGRLKINTDFKINTEMYIVIPQDGNSICTIEYLQNNSKNNITYLHRSASGICKLLIDGLEYPFIASTSNIPKSILYAGRSFWNTSINRLGYYINNKWVDTDNYPLNKKTGTSDERPTISDNLIGFQYFDTNLNKPIYAVKAETHIEDITTSPDEYTGANNLNTGDTYIIKTISGQGLKFGYKDDTYHFVDIQTFTTELVFTAKNYPLLYVVSNVPNSNFSIYKIEYKWVDATGADV